MSLFRAAILVRHRFTSNFFSNFSRIAWLKLEVTVLCRGHFLSIRNGTLPFNLASSEKEYRKSKNRKKNVTTGSIVP